MTNVLLVKNMLVASTGESIILMKSMFMDHPPTVGLALLFTEDISFFVSNVIYRDWMVYTPSDYVCINHEYYADEGDYMEFIERYKKAGWSVIKEDDEHLKGITI